MKKLFLLLGLLCMASAMYAQGLLNTMGFESGNNAAWNQFTGSCCPVNAVVSGTVNGGVTSGSGIDSYGGFPTVYPNGGNYSFKLGNDTGTNQSDRITFSFPVNFQNYYLKTSFAEVLQKGGVPAVDDSRFYIRVLDNSGNDIFNTSQCAYCNFNAAASGYTQSPVNPTVYYRNWTQQIINLHQYVGQTVTIEVNSGDAISPSTNFGYGYFDLESEGEINITEQYCINNSYFYLIAPIGAYTSYAWYNDNDSLLSNSAVVKIDTGTGSHQQVNNWDYVIVTPFPGQGIVDTVYDTLKLTAHSNPNAVIVFNSICIGSPIQLNDASNATDPINAWSWNFGDTGSGANDSSNLQNPSHSYSTVGNKTITLIVSSVFGCMDTAQTVIAVQLPHQVFAGNDTSACVNQAIVLGATPLTSGGSGNFNYQWQTIGGGSFNNAALAHPTGLFTSASLVVLSATDNITHCVSSDSLNFSLQSICNNTAPIAVNDVANTANFLVNIPVLNNDIDVDGNSLPQGNLTTASVSIVTAPLNGTATINGLTIDYTPNISFVGNDSLIYSVCDNGSPNLCATAKVIIHVFAPLTLNLGADVSNCNGDTSYAAPAITGGSGNLIYSWSPLSGLSCTNCAAPMMLPSTTTTYILTVTDALTSQVIVDNIIVHVGTSGIYIGNDTALLMGAAITMNAVNTGSSSIVTYSWNPAPTVGCTNCANPTYTPTSILNYIVTTTDAIGCTATDTVRVLACSTDCVWPGDADHNGSANHIDVLEIGLGYNYTGPVRFPYLQDTFWNGHPAEDFTLSSFAGINFKHADCNGNGVVDSIDVEAIAPHFDFPSPILTTVPLPTISSPTLLVTMSAPGYGNGSHAVATISLGDATIPADSIYGIAFTFTFDTMVVNRNTCTMTILNSWLFPTANAQVNLIHYNRKDGLISTGICRKNHLNKSGNGPIALVDMDINTDDIAGRMTQWQIYHMWDSVINIVLIDRHGVLIPVNKSKVNTPIAYVFNGTETINLAKQIDVMPNPATDILKINAAGNLKINSITITDIAGRKLNTIDLKQAASNYSMDVSTYQQGVYLLEINTNSGKVTKQFVVQR